MKPELIHLSKQAEHLADEMADRKIRWASLFDLGVHDYLAFQVLQERVKAQHQQEPVTTPQ
jgi:hypothetical protein